MSIFFWSKCLKLWFFIFISCKNPLIRPPCYYKQYYFTSTRRTKGSNAYPLNIVFPSLPIVRIAEHFAVESEIEIQSNDHLVVDLNVNEHNWQVVPKVEYSSPNKPIMKKVY